LASPDYQLPVIDKAYRQLAGMFISYRADYAERSDVQRQLDQLFGKIKIAHQTLRDSLKRRDYDLLLSAATVHPPRTPGVEGAARKHQIYKPPKPNNPEPRLDRGETSIPVRESKLPARKPIPIPELQMPVAPRGGSNAGTERGQWDGSRLASTPPGTSGPLTRPPAVLSPEEVSRLKKGSNNDQQALHFYRQGRLRFERREMDAAAHLFRQAVKLDDTQPHYHFYLGIVLSIQANARH
jgi:hypothetical protein